MKNSYFDNIVHFIVSKCGIIEKTFVLALFISILCYPFVGINYDLSTYLPEFAPTKQALDVMEDEFGYPGLARVMLKNVSVQEAKRIREEIADVDGVSIVLGPDSVTQTYMSESFVQSSLDDFNNIIGKGNTFYKDGNAVMEIVFEEGSYDQKTREAVDKIYKIAGDNASYAGSAVANKERQESVVKELTVAVILALFVTFALLALTTESWFEPVLFILIMGIVFYILNIGNTPAGSFNRLLHIPAAYVQILQEQRHGNETCYGVCPQRSLPFDTLQRRHHDSRLYSNGPYEV